MLVRAVFAVQTGEAKVLRSAENLIAAAQENLEVELVCFGEGIFLALSGGPPEQDLMRLLHTTQGPGATVSVTITDCRNFLRARFGRRSPPGGGGRRSVGRGRGCPAVDPAPA